MTISPFFTVPAVLVKVVPLSFEYLLLGSPLTLMEAVVVDVVILPKATV